MYYFLKDVSKVDMEQFASLVPVAYRYVDELRADPPFINAIDDVIEATRQWIFENDDIDGSKRCLDNIPDTFKKDQKDLWSKIVLSSNRSMPGFEKTDRADEEKYIGILMECLQAAHCRGALIPQLGGFIYLYKMRDAYITVFNALQKYAEKCEGSIEDVSAMAGITESLLLTAISDLAEYKIADGLISEKIPPAAHVLAIIVEYIQWRDYLNRISDPESSVSERCPSADFFSSVVRKNEVETEISILMGLARIQSEMKSELSGDHLPSPQLVHALQVQTSFLSGLAVPPVSRRKSSCADDDGSLLPVPSPPVRFRRQGTVGGLFFGGGSGSGVGGDPKHQLRASLPGK